MSPVRPYRGRPPAALSTVRPSPSRRRRRVDCAAHLPAGAIELLPRTGDRPPFTDVPLQPLRDIGKPESTDGPRRALERVRRANPVRVTLGRVECLERLRDLIDEKPKHFTFQRSIPQGVSSEMIVIDEDGRVYPCQGMQGVFDAKNLKEVGFKEAFDNLKKKPCYTCYLVSMINTSAMINWDLGVIGETIRGTLRSRLWKNKLVKK